MTEPAASVGRHVLADVRGCDHPVLDDGPGLEALLRDAAVAAGATVISSHHHRFEPHGVSALCVLSESHVSVHTWPELGSASLDAYTCGHVADPLVAVRFVLDAVGATDVDLVMVERGGPHALREMVVERAGATA